MRIKSRIKKRPAAVSRIAFIALLFLTMAAATLHLDALAAHAAQATLSWSAPTTYTDGSLLTNLNGYTVHTGTASGSYSKNIAVGNVTSYTVSSLNDGTTYYFAVSANDASGNASKPSNQVSFTTPAAPPPVALYTLTASAGSGGSITPSGSIVVSEGTSQTFAIAPSTGYAIAGVAVDGVSVGAVSSYTFSKVSAKHSISATFAPKISSYTITASAGTGGSISPAGAALVSSGGSKSYTITPATGYKVADVKVDGTSVGAVASYTFSNVTANRTIAASFASAAGTGSGSSATWQNQSIVSQSGTFTASFDMIPSANNINAVTGLSALQAKGYEDVATIVRFNPAGTIDARNGGVYAARVALPYSAGKVYRVRMLINVPTHRYDVYVTPPGLAETQLAAGYAFRTEQAAVSALNNLSTFAGAGSHQLLNLSVTAASAPVTSSASWQTQSIASKSGIFTARFDMIPNANNINAVSGFSALQAKGYEDVAAIVRFNPAGTIDVRNGNAYAARVALPYSAGKVYRVRMLINVPTHRYDVYVTPPGGTETQLAAGYAFRTEQAAVAALNNLSIFAGAGSHQLRDLSLL